MKKLSILYILMPLVIYAEEPISFIEIFGGNYELPAHCINYTENPKDDYNIRCSQPNKKFFLSIQNDKNACAKSDELRSTDIATITVTKEYMSHGLSVLEYSIATVRSDFVGYFRQISSDTECLVILGDSFESINLIEIGAW